MNERITTRFYELNLIFIVFLHTGSSNRFYESNRIVFTCTYIHIHIPSQDILKKLVESGELTDINVQDDRGCSPLIWATRAGQDTAVDYLLEKGADFETQGFGGIRPLHHATNQSKESIVQALLNAGANPNNRDENNNTALHYAAAR